jgi:uncharacterized membrane protein YphA (DoxX/SURF4 family)
MVTHLEELGGLAIIAGVLAALVSVLLVISMIIAAPRRRPTHRFADRRS